MGMLRTCEHPGCNSWTLGRLCSEHEPARRTVRRRRWTPPAQPRETARLEGRAR